MIKKMLLLTVAVCLLIPFRAHANGIDPDIEFYSANYNNGIVLDGDLSEWTGVDVIESPSFLPQGGGARVTFEEHSGGTWSGPDDHSANILISWDDENIYLGLVVTDDYHQNPGDGWNGDSAQVHIANAARDTQIALYNYALTGIEGGAMGPVVKHEESGPGGTEAVITRNSPITTYEIQFPMASLGFDELNVDMQFGLGMAINDGDDGPGQDGQKGWSGLGPDVVVFGKEPAETALITLAPEGNAEPFSINGGGETYLQDFDEMATGKRLPKGWKGELDAGVRGSATSLGLQDGPLIDLGNDPVRGIINAGGNSERFSSSDANMVGTWQAELGGDGALFDAGDVIADGATDRALGNARLSPDEVGKLTFSIDISDKPLRALVVDWDLEVWGGDPDGEYRGADGAGYTQDISVGGTSYFSTTQTLIPGDTFYTFDDGADDAGSPTLIDGNVHSIRGISSELIEVSTADGAIGNSVNLTFDSNHGGADEGWIPAIDNVRVRAVAPGDVDGNGSVDPLDIVELLKGGQFGKGVNGVTWQQGDFNGDDQFDPNDLVAVLTFLNGEFPTTYASELGNPGDGTPDVIVDFTTGEVVIDFAGHISSSIIIDSAAGVFNGDAPAWDTMGEFRTASAAQISNTLFSGTESGVDSLGNLVKAEFMNDAFDFNADLTVKILVATPDGPVTVDGHVIVVPEPSTWMLLGLGSLALVAVVRRRMA